MSNWFIKYFPGNNEHGFGRIPDPPEPPEDDELKISVGDVLKCKDRDDMINTMHDLIMEGIETEFRYEYLGEKGLWLEVIAIDD